MEDLCRITRIQALADLLCLSVFFYVKPTVSPAKIVLFYFASKIAVFTLYRSQK